MGLFKGQTDLDSFESGEKDHECEPVEQITPRLNDDVEEPLWFCKHCNRFMGRGW